MSAREAVLVDDALPEREAEVVGIDGERGLLAGRNAHHVGARLDRGEVGMLRQEFRLA